ncbi:MAG: serine/threonine-protein kinase, partial [Myxococcota bacterium]
VMFALSRSNLPPGRILNLALGYQVIGAFIWAISDLSGAPPGFHPGEGVSFVVLWVTLFPVVAASSLRAGFVANMLASFSLYPAYALLHALDLTDVSVFRVGAMSGPLVTVAVIAMVPVYLRVRLAKSLETAERLGSYELVSRLGQGGMGEVWKARHNLLAHDAAIKLIRQSPAGSEGSSPDVVAQRFEREARATVSLKSPHTVDLYDFGVAANGTWFYVMELLDGIDLETLVKRYGPIPAERVIYLLRQACHSLADAHDRKLVHRDIKPANLFLCSERAGDFDHVKVLDFGLVTLQPRMTEQSTRLTTEGVITGTPAYLAPETITAEHIDERADIYSLGCVGFWLLTGRLAFEASTPMAMVVAHAKEAPVAPSTLAEMPIPAELDTLILSCLAKVPDDRPTSARELSERMSACGIEQPWTQERARQWWDANRPCG